MPLTRLAVGLCLVFVGLAHAQDETPPPKEGEVPPKKEAPAPKKEAPPVPTVPPIIGGPGCTAPCPPKTTYRIEYAEQEVTVPKLKLKEVTCRDKQPTLELKPQVHQRLRQDMVLQPRETLKEVTICTQKLVTKTDPVTGCKVQVLEPVTEKKLVKEIHYIVCPKETVETFQTFCLKEGTREVQLKRLELEHTTERKVERRPLLIPTITNERILSQQPPCCDPPDLKKVTPKEAEREIPKELPPTKE